MNKCRVASGAILLFLFVLFLLPQPASALHCEPSSTKLHIFFINGILTTKKEAKRAREQLCRALDAEQLEPEIVCDLTYNDTDGPFEDLLEVADQILTQYSSQLLLWLHGVGQVPDWLLAWQQKMLLVEYQINASELPAHVEDYRNALHGAEKVLIVAHSQGNLYANQAYELVAKAEPEVFQNSLAIYAVATPANNVAGDGLHLTNHRDVIQLIPGALAPNWSLWRTISGIADDVGMVAAHSFLNTYLSNEFDVREILLDDIVQIGSVFLDRPAPELITSCAKAIASISLQPPNYTGGNLRFTATIENPERDLLTVDCTDDIDGLAFAGCEVIDDWVAYDRLETFVVHGRVSYTGVPRGTGAVTLLVSDSVGNTVAQTFPVSWDCCDGPNLHSFIHYHTKYSCDVVLEHENHCGSWWQ